MNTNDFNSIITSDTLNESMFKKFGAKINFDKYTREDLENYRNLLRTKVNQQESGSGFNDLLANENYQKDKHMLGLLNTKIKEMLGESVLAEKSTSKKQARTMAAAAHDPKFAKKVGIKQKVAKEFNKADTGTKQLSKAMKTKKTTEAAEKKVAPAAKKVAPAALKGGQKKLDVAPPKGKLDKKDFAALRSKKKIKESVMSSHYRTIIEGLQQFLREDEEGKAKDITAGTDMVNDFTSWMQRVGQYQTKSMIELSDSIRANFGQADADIFKSAIEPALQEALSSLTQARETITRAVAVLAGEEGAEAPMGMDAGGLPGAEAPAPEAGLDTMNDMGSEDEFGASDAAAGGTEVAGRELRESRRNAYASRLAEAHSIMSKLAK